MNNKENTSINTRVPNTSETSSSQQRIPPRPGPVFDGPQSIETDSECLPKYKRDLVAKQKILRTELAALQPQTGHMRLEVSRSEIFEVYNILNLVIWFLIILIFRSHIEQ